MPRTPPGQGHDEGAPSEAITTELPDDQVAPDMSGRRPEPYPLAEQSPLHFLDEVPYTLPYPQAAAPGHLQEGSHPLHFSALGGSLPPHWAPEGEEPSFLWEGPRQDAQHPDQQ